MKFNVFYSTFTNVFSLFLSRFLRFLTFFLNFNLNLFLHLCSWGNTYKSHKTDAVGTGATTSEEADDTQQNTDWDEYERQIWDYYRRWRRHARVVTQ